MRGLKGKAAIVNRVGRQHGPAPSACGWPEEGSDRRRCSIRMPKLPEAVAAEVERAGARGVPVAADITDYVAVSIAAVAEFERTAGPTAILVNNAGWDKFAYFLDTEAGAVGRADCGQPQGPDPFAPRRAQRHAGSVRAGRVINIASDAGRVGSSMEAVYSACKGSIIAFTKTMAREMARSGVTLNAVCPRPDGDAAAARSFHGRGEGPE